MAKDTNYTLYYNVLNYLKEVMDRHPSINYVTQGDIFSVDTKSFPQYPLGNVIITNATFDGKSTDYSVQIIVADKTKLKGNESSGSNNTQTIEFEGVDDTVDIHANTLAIINDILSYTDRVEEGFEVNGTVNCTAFKERFDNGLAGWSADFTLRVHNDRNICLFDLSTDNDVSAYQVQNCATSQSYYVTFRESIGEDTGSFWTTEIESGYNSYNIVGEFTIEDRNLNFENVDVVTLQNYSSSVINEKWWTDCDSSNQNWTVELISLSPTTATYLDQNGEVQELSGLGGTICTKGVLDVGGFTYASNRTEGCS